MGLVILMPFCVALKQFESILSSIPEDTPIVSKAITLLSGQSHPTCPETKLFILETESKPNNFSHPGVDEDLSLNPKCMTTSDWVEAQSRDKNVREIICLFKVKELQDQKGKETDSPEMKNSSGNKNTVYERWHLVL